MGNRLMITGFSGFVSRHFLSFLSDNHINMVVCGLDIQEPMFDYRKDYAGMKIQFHIINLLDEQSIKEIVSEFLPDFVLHLASFSSVAYSWEHPMESFINNTNIFLNMITAIRESNCNCRILSIGSSEEYGDVSEKDIPIGEEQMCRPLSPYAVARVSQEMLSSVYSKSYHMNIVMTRSFNHIGPWQDDRFAVPGFIKRIYEVKKSGMQKGEIETGDISIVRDFVDVRDVVRAYYLLLLYGRSGEIYNVCSGKGFALNEIIDFVAQEFGVEITTRTNPKYLRTDDNRIIIGSPEKIQKEFGWKPLIDIKQTLRDMISEVDEFYS